MRFRILITTLVCISSGFAFGAAAPAHADGRFAFPEDTSYEPRAALVQVDSGVSSSDVAAALAAQNTPARTEDVADGLVHVKFPAGTDAEAAVNGLVERGEVQSAQPNFRYALVDNAQDEGSDVTDEDAAGEGDAADLAGVDDPQASEQWHLGSIGAFDAWNIAKAQQAVTVAAFDLGCEVDHEDLRDNIVAPYNAVDGSTDVTPAPVNPKHGTHVTGIIGAVAGNGVGVCGVSYNAKVMPVDVVDSSGTASTDDVIKAYDYVMASPENVRVVNLSLGVVQEVSEDDALLNKVDEAYSAGIVTVASAGNTTLASAPFHIYPADHPNIVSVINLEQSSSGVSRSSKSNYNFAGEQAKNISAPGTDVLSTIPGNAYGRLSGTSMAAPVVAGVLALEFAACPDLSASDAVELLYSTATKIDGEGFSAEYGWGEVNALQAVRAAQERENTMHHHSLGHVAATDPTCTSDGNGEHWRCSSCGLAFADALGRLQVALEDTVKPAYGHSWGASAVVKKASATAAGTRARMCLECGSVKTSKIAKAKKLEVTARAVRASAGKRTVVKAASAFAVNNAMGALSYTLKRFVTKKAKGKVSVSKKGKVAIKAKLGKGTYEVRVRVKAAGNAAYKAQAKTVTLTLRLR